MNPEFLEVKSTKKFNNDNFTDTYRSLGWSVMSNASNVWLSRTSVGHYGPEVFAEMIKDDHRHAQNILSELVWMGQSVVGNQFDGVTEIHELYSDDFYRNYFTKKLRGACSLWSGRNTGDLSYDHMEAYMSDQGVLRLVLTSKGYDFFTHAYPEIPVNPFVHNVFKRMLDTREKVTTGRFIFIRFLPDPIIPKIEFEKLVTFTNKEFEKYYFELTINGAKANGFEMEDNLSLDSILENGKPVRMQLAE